MGTLPTQLLCRFRIRRKRICSRRNFFTIILVIAIGFILIEMATIDFEELLSLRNHLIHRQKQNYTERSTVSSTVNHEEDDAKQLENIGIFNIDWRQGRWDSKHRYKFLDFVWPGNKFIELSKKYTVSVATQSSLEKLHSIVDVSRHWTGPVSLAVFVAGDEFRLTEIYITYLRQCFPRLKDQTSFHLAYSGDFPPIYGTKLTLDYKQNCSNPEAVLSDLLEYRSPLTIEWKKNTPYPQNHLRNQARYNCQTDYIYVIDVDIIPCFGMADNLDQFLRNSSQCEKKCAYVIPVFEIHEKSEFPRNKSEMLELLNIGTARPFHQKIYRTAQFGTNYAKWKNNTQDVTDAVHVSHLVTKCRLGYEPFYVAPADTPGYDERFIGYGYTRNTQVYEMAVAGYQFQVLSPIFSFHLGYYTYNNTYNPSRKQQVKVNSRLVKSFKAEVAARYPKRKATC